MIPCRPAITFCSIVGHARRQTAGPMGPSTIERSNRWTGFSAGSDIPGFTNPGEPGSGFDDDLEASVNHASGVEGHLRLHHRGDAGVLHYLRVDPIAMRPRLEHDPREDDGLAALSFDGAREGNPPPLLQILAGAL